MVLTAALAAMMVVCVIAGAIICISALSAPVFQLILKEVLAHFILSEVFPIEDIVVFLLTPCNSIYQINDNMLVALAMYLLCVYEYDTVPEHN